MAFPPVPFPYAKLQSIFKEIRSIHVATTCCYRDSEIDRCCGGEIRSRRRSPDGARNGRRYLHSLIAWRLQSRERGCSRRGGKEVHLRPFSNPLLRRVDRADMIIQFVTGVTENIKHSLQSSLGKKERRGEGVGEVTFEGRRNFMVRG